MDEMDDVVKEEFIDDLNVNLSSFPNCVQHNTSAGVFELDKFWKQFRHIQKQMGLFYYSRLIREI